MLALCSSGYSQGWRWLVPWRLIGGCTYWFAAGFSSEPRAGVNTRKVSPARQRRARGRIELALLDGDVAPTDLRPSLANRTITPSPLNVVNVHSSVFKAQERGKARAGARFVGELRPFERSRCDEHGRVATVRHVACARPTGDTHARITHGPAQRAESARSEGRARGRSIHKARPRAL